MPPSPPCPAMGLPPLPVPSATANGGPVLGREVGLAVTSGLFISWSSPCGQSLTKWRCRQLAFHSVLEEGAGGCGGCQSSAGQGCPAGISSLLHASPQETVLKEVGVPEAAGHQHGPRSPCFLPSAWGLAEASWVVPVGTQGPVPRGPPPLDSGVRGGSSLFLPVVPAAAPSQGDPVSGRGHAGLSPGLPLQKSQAPLGLCSENLGRE